MLKYRVHFSTTLNKELYIKLKELSLNSRISVSKLTDEAVQLLLAKHKEKHQDKP